MSINVYYKESIDNLNHILPKEIGLWDIPRINLDKTTISMVKKIINNINIGNKQESILPDLKKKLIKLIYYIDINRSFYLEILDIISLYNHSLTKKTTIKILNKLSNDKIHFDLLTPEYCINILEYKLSKINEKIKILYGKIDKLEEAIEFLDREPIHKEITFLFLFGEHITPLILRKSEDKNRIEILCIDSVGYTDLEGKTYTRLLVNYLIKTERGIDFYFLKIKRQNDLSNCAVFAISDIISFYKLKKNQYDLFSHIEKNSNLLQGNELDKTIDSKLSDSEIKTLNISIFTFEKIPPIMMKLTQSISSISTYLEKYPEYACEIVQKSRQETLLENVERYTFFDEDKRQNMHSEIRYAQLIIGLFKKSFYLNTENTTIAHLNCIRT